jgi:DNA mismatch endonuclease (patch repair protein)
MADVFTQAKRSLVMSAIRSRGNRDTEMKLASIFKQSGIIGWRRNVPLPGKPDFVFRLERLAVFVDGCFWHGCPVHGRKPGSNRSYWLPKLARNRARDLAVTRELRRRGWRVLRIWEHALRHSARVASRRRRALLPTASLSVLEPRRTLRSAPPAQ